MTHLSFADLRAATVARQAEWCPDPAKQPDLSFRAVELAGEAGEVCNVIKKLVREEAGWAGSRAGIDDLADEIADVVISADLLALTAGIDLAAAVQMKFDATSAKHGFKTRLGKKSPVNAVEQRPQNCRNRMRDEGKAYPKSGCVACVDGGLRGCPYEEAELTAHGRDVFAKKERRIAELMEANNAYLERARIAEARVAELESFIHFMSTGARSVPSDGTCVRCGGAPTNAMFLCATCVDEDAASTAGIDRAADEIVPRETDRRAVIDDASDHRCDIALSARVRTICGAYQLDGVVVGMAVTEAGAVRYVVEHTPAAPGLLHIYSAQQLAHQA